MNMHHKNNKLLFLLTLLVTACGGGGGGGGGSNTPPPSPAPTISFSASPVSVLLNSTSTFSWSSTNATSCTASGSTQWSGSKAISGTEDVLITISGNTTFTLSCSGAGGSRNASVTIEGFRQTDGVVVDGYISGADVFIDENENFIADGEENSTTSDNDGKFTIKYANGSLVSIGGTDLDSQTLLDNLLITHKLDGFSDFKAITPVTSVDAFLESADINAALGIDSSINVGVDDPVALKGDGGIYDYLYEKGNQLTVLAYALQNITNDLNTTTETTQDFFKSIAEEVEIEYAETQSKVDIETTDFISKVLTNVETAKTLNLNETDKSNTVTALASVIPIIQVKEDADTTTSLIRFGVSQLQEDIVSLANGSASEELVEDYTQDVINYIATTESISSDNLTPDISSIDDSVVLDEDSAIDIFILNNDSFVAGAPFSISTTLPMNGDIETTNNYITYSPDADFFGDDEFSYTLLQGDKTSSADVNITINSINDAPSIDIASTLTVSENQTAITTISISDVDEDELTLTLGGTDASSLNLSTENVLSFKEAPDYETKDNYSINLSLTDGTETVEKDISILITDINDAAPVFTSSATFNAPENQLAIGTVTANDEENDEVSFSISGEELAITLEGVLTFVSAPDFETKSSYSAVVTVSDGINEATQDISVNVTNVNDNPPIFTSSAIFSAPENQAAIGTVAATDGDGDSVTFTVSGSEIEIISSASGEVLSFVSAPDYETKSTYTATVTASDGINSTTQDITVNVTDVDENVDTGPVFTSDSTFEVAENQLVIGEVTATDPDGDSISFSTISTEIIIDSLTGNMTFVSSPNFEAKSIYTATILASDGVNESTQDITINITNVVEAPEAFDKTIIFRVLPQIQTEQNIALPADGDNLTYIIVSNPSKGTLTLNGNIATYKALLNYTTSDTDSFTFKVSNGSEESSVATLSIDIMTDPLYKYQWHLENTGQTTFATNAGIADEDLNLNTVISSGYTGAGVTVAVIDSGLEIDHEDLADNMVPGSYDFLDSDTDPTNTIDVLGDHGTSVAGIIAAAGWNALGGRGVAPDASLVGYNLLQNGFASYQLQSWGINPPVDANVDIYNMSYGNYYTGASETFALPDYLDAYYEDALVTATTELRSGKGALYVQSSGNEYSDYATADCGENEFTCVEVIWDNWSTVPYILQVGALNANGQKSSYTTTGAALWVSGFGGENGANESILNNQNLEIPSGIYEPAILTTDQSSCSKGYVGIYETTTYNEFENSTGNNSINSECNYTSTFAGTSSAAPTVAGVMALIISANPNLTWRDVKHIIASTSDQVGTDSDYTYDFQGINQYEWETNSAGYKFHNWFGFGKINAADAVAMALSMEGNNLGTFQTTGFQQEVQDEVAISDTETTSATIQITKPDNSNNFIEFVRVSIQFNHWVPKSIGLRLVSPDGTEVNIMQPMTNLGTNPTNTLFDIGVSGLYGESIEGTWTLYADDYIEDAIEGSLIQWGIEIYGN